MKLADAIFSFCEFFKCDTDICVTRTNKKTNTQYTFIIAMIRYKGHLYVEYEMQELFDKLQDRTCNIYGNPIGDEIRIIVKE